MADERMAVANTIRDQIGHRALFMIGAKSFFGSADSLMFKVGRGASNEKGSVTHIKITLDANDTYTMEAMFVRGLKCTTRAKVEGAYVDMLHPFIKDATGMCLSL